MQFRLLLKDAPNAREILGFAKEWWGDHIARADKEYSPHLLGKGADR